MITLKRLTIDSDTNWDIYASWLNDDQTVRFSENRFKRHTAETCKAYVESVRPPDRLFAIMLNDQHIGVGHLAVDLINKLVDISIMLGTKRGEGFGITAWKLLMDEAWRTGARKITAGTMLTNNPMIRTALAAEMHVEHIRERHFLVDGVEVDLIQFEKYRRQG